MAQAQGLARLWEDHMCYEDQGANDERPTYDGQVGDVAAEDELD